MAKPALPFPTELELKILNIIWSGDGKGTTVRTVRDALAKSGKNVAYNTVLTMMTIMTRKGHLKRKTDKTGLRHAYVAKAAQAATRKGMLRDIVERTYGGNAAEAIKDLQEK